MQRNTDPTRTSGGGTSLWTTSFPPAPLDPLAKDASADVCVVGAGIAGLTTAYLAARQGHRVVVLDDGAIGSGETGRTTAHLTTALDDRYQTLERYHGAEGARLAAASHSTAIDVVELIVDREGIDCDFERVDGYLFADSEGHAEELDRELAAAHRAGLRAVRRVARAPYETFDTGPALLFPSQAQFHPLAYLAGLARAIARWGGTVHTGSHAARIERGPVLRVHTSAGPSVSARAVVVATNTPVFDVVAIHTKQAAYRSYVTVLPVARGAVPPTLLWDTGRGERRPRAYHYVRVARGLSEVHDHLLVGGEDHKTGQAEDGDARFDALEAWARERFPVTGPPTHRWSGQVAEPVDGLAYIGLEPGSNHAVYVATGDSGNGMTHGTIAGILLADVMNGRENAWARLYDPGRVTLAAAGTYARENANVVRQYADWMRAGDVRSAEEVPFGGGAILVQGLRRLAVHRDAEGSLHVRSAVCPHLGGVVRWNAAERTWDCPCHGSRFDPEGRVVNGPANVDLAPADLREVPADEVRVPGVVGASPDTP